MEHGLNHGRTTPITLATLRSERLTLQAQRRKERHERRDRFDAQEKVAARLRSTRNSIGRDVEKEGAPIQRSAHNPSGLDVHISVKKSADSPSFEPLCGSTRSPPSTRVAKFPATSAYRPFWRAKESSDERGRENNVRSECDPFAVDDVIDVVQDSRRLYCRCCQHCYANCCWYKILSLADETVEGTPWPKLIPLPVPFVLRIKYGILKHDELLMKI